MQCSPVTAGALQDGTEDGPKFSAALTRKGKIIRPHGGQRKDSRHSVESSPSLLWLKLPPRTSRWRVGVRPDGQQGLTYTHPQPWLLGHGAPRSEDNGTPTKLLRVK